MKSKINSFMFFIAFSIKLLLSCFVTTNIFFVNLIFVSIIFFSLLKKATKIFVPVVMMDFSIQALMFLELYGYKGISLLIAIVYFIVSSGCMYYLLICNVSELTSPRMINRISNVSVDKGIKALESQDYDLAIEEFTNAIKKSRKNYLGYMGMCSVLTQMDKKNLKRLNYYKKKCIKYAPDDLKESIINKY